MTRTGCDVRGSAYDRSINNEECYSTSAYLRIGASRLCTQVPSLDCPHLRHSVGTARSDQLSLIRKLEQGASASRAAFRGVRCLPYASSAVGHEKVFQTVRFRIL